MNLLSMLTTRIPVRRALAAISLSTVGAFAVAADLPQFTLNPVAAGLVGASFSGDNILISNYSVVTSTGGTFTDRGFLAISSIQSGGATSTPGGLNSTYGMYIAFEGSGTASTVNPTTTPTFGSFTSLTYTLFGYNGTAAFGFSGNTPTETATGEVVLATGSLVNGSVSTIPTGDGSYTPSAAAKLTFNVAAGQSTFFSAPNPFFNSAFAAFTNTVSQVDAFDGGFRIRQGGGAFNFVPLVPIPEPESYALMLAGLIGLGALRSAKRRRSL